MIWDNTYKTGKYIWGEKPSELATFACNYLQEIRPSFKSIEILDLGCGYGRDAIFLARSANCNVLGIDNASEAIEMAQSTLADDLKSHVRFQCCDFKQMLDGKFEILFASNLYQLLEIENRSVLRDIIKKRLKRGGILFLSTLSTNDPEHFGRGKQIQSEDNSFEDEKFLHLCTREELERDFSFLTIKQLYEHEYYEHHSKGKTHHHISWLLLGINQ